MLTATQAREQSATQRQVFLAQEHERRRWPSGVDFATMAERVKGELEERVYACIKEGKTDAHCWWPCEDLPTWMAIAQEVTPYFKGRGYDLEAMPRKEHGFRMFNVLVSW